MWQLFDSHQTVPDYPRNTRTSKIEQDSLVANFYKDSMHGLVDKATWSWRLHNKGKFFGATFVNVTPTQWATNNLSLGVMVASANHRCIMMHWNVDWEVEGAKIPYMHALNTRPGGTMRPTVLADYFKYNPTFLPDHAVGSALTT